MLSCQRPDIQGVDGKKDTQALVGQEQYLAAHGREIALMPKRPHAVIGEVGKGVCHAAQARVDRIGGVLHLPDSAFLQDARLGNLLIAVAAILELRDHEAGHVCDAGLNHTGGESRRLTLVIGERLEAAIDIPISTG